MTTDPLHQEDRWLDEQAEAQTKFQIDIQVDDDFKESVDEYLLTEAIRETLYHQNVAGASLTLVITDDEQVQELNRAYRGIDAPTDVLSFAEQEPANGPFALADEFTAQMAVYLGDILIAYPYTERQAERNLNPFDAELQLLTIHGTLHLLGYDHGTVQEEAEMWAIQDAILERCRKNCE